MERVFRGVAVYFATWLFQDKGIYRTGYDPEYRATGKLSDETFLELDLEMLVRAEQAAAAALASERKCLVGYSVHSTTLQRRNLRSAYIQRLSTVPERLRKYMLARVAQVEPGTPLITLTEWIGALRPISPHVVVQFHRSERVMDGLMGTGLSSVAIHLPMTGDVDLVQQQQYAQLIGRWSAMLKKQNIRLSIDNVLDPLLVELCCRMDINTITSAAIWPLLRETQGVVRFPRAELQSAIARKKSA